MKGIFSSSSSAAGDKPAALLSAALTPAHFAAADRLGELLTAIDPKQEGLIKERDNLRKLLRDAHRSEPGHLICGVIGQKFEVTLMPAGFETKFRMHAIVAAVRKAKLAFADVFSITLGTLEKRLPDQVSRLTYKEQTGTREIIITALAPAKAKAA